MKNEMKTPKEYKLEIPYNPTLDALSLEEAGNALEELGVRLSVESLNWPETYPYRPLTVITAAHSNRYLYLDFLVRCNYLRAVNFTDNTPVSEDSCVEFYVQPRPDTDEYWALEFNCVGTINALKCRGNDQCEHLGEEEMRAIRRYASVGSRPFQEVEGSFIWSIVAAIPLSLFGMEYNGEPIHMRGNFNKCASATSQPHYLSWAPITTDTPDFHRPDCFGAITLV